MRRPAEPILDIAHLGHVELMTPDLEASLWYFRELLGMSDTEITDLTEREVIH